MRIRDANGGDIPRLLDMAARFCAASGHAAYAKFDPAGMEHTLRRLIDGDDGILLVAEDAAGEGGLAGMAGGLVYPLYFSSGRLTGQELFWWVEPGLRGSGAGHALLRRMEGAARDRGAGTFVMGALESLRPRAVGALYERSGYRPMEHLYLRRL